MVRFIEKMVMIDREILKDKVILEIGCGVRSKGNQYRVDLVDWHVL